MVDDNCRSTTCLLVLCGLPGAGKTSIARKLVEYINERNESAEQCATPKIIVHHVCFDDIASDYARGSVSGASGHTFSAAFDPTVWKAAREHAYAQIEERLLARQARLKASEESSSRTAAEQLGGGLVVDSGNLVYELLVADDNMYYRSMRHSLFLRARSYGAAYVQLHVATDVAQAIAGNKQRPLTAQVSDTIIERMAGLFEKPNAEIYQWESTSVTATLATTR
eukprot:CAMPEP_0198219340 /NCGR_PEP_ID=MMETSP1445-20131203/73845_1 /TAXON_ID=36898 /ORGANISM="Pyramimonas sp., Strain CCMP2087" /LENGTH=224 /DNA_ID=CAMNT_0043896717 /DNA_START=55 /DNA_END=726 /DNA_ORIENTATION=-